MLSESCLWFVFLLLPNLHMRRQSVKQTSGSLTVSEGKHLSLSCSYETQFSNTVFTYWYIQHPGQPLKFLLTEYENDGQGFHATHHEGDKNGTYNLEKEASQLKDSAVYFCAIRDTMRESRRGVDSNFHPSKVGKMKTHCWYQYADSVNCLERAVKAL
uniref:Ig-like domain-containing protein n=1 Tax=Naja naja TaxID=35670 RepID=A0A8C6VT22_NAJNA